MTDKEGRENSVEKRRCPMCGEEILAIAEKCKHCGEYFDETGQPIKRKNRMVFILLALCFGGLGVHNFYIGKSTSGMCEAMAGVLGGLFLYHGLMPDSGIYATTTISIGSILLVITGLWILWDIISVTKDADGNEMQ